MQENAEPEKPASEDAGPREIVEMIFCVRHGRRVPVTFEVTSGSIVRRTDVAACPLRDDETCDLACLTSAGG